MQRMKYLVPMVSTLKEFHYTYLQGRLTLTGLLPQGMQCLALLLQPGFHLNWNINSYHEVLSEYSS